MSLNGILSIRCHANSPEQHEYRRKRKTNRILSTKMLFEFIQIKCTHYNIFTMNKSEVDTNEIAEIQ